MHILKNSLFLTILLLTAPTKAFDPTPVQALAATIAAAATGVAGYQLYNYVHYHSAKNCKDGLEALKTKLQDPENLLFAAAYADSVDALLSLYKQKLEYYSDSLSITQLTQKILSEAQQKIDTLSIEAAHLKKYSKYNDPAHEELVARCEHSLKALQVFCQKLEESDLTPIHQLLLDYLHDTVYQKLHTPERSGRYPQHSYVRELKNAYWDYKQYLQDNQITTPESELLLQESNHASETVRNSNEYLKEEIAQLQYNNRSLSASVGALCSRVDSLQRDLDNEIYANRVPWWEQLQQNESARYR